MRKSSLTITSNRPVTNKLESSSLSSELQSGKLSSKDKAENKGNQNFNMSISRNN